MRSLCKDRSGFLAFLLLLALLIVVPAGANADFRRFVTGYVNDHAGLLRPEEERELSALLADLDVQTTNQFIVVTLPGLPPGENLELFALRLAEAAQPGTAERDNGLLLLILSNERKIRVEVGTGLEEKITDGRAGRVIREVLAPAFQKEAYFSGIKEALEVFIHWVEPSYLPEGSAKAAFDFEEEEGPGVLFFLILFLLLTVFSTYTSRYQQRRWYKRGYSQRTMGPVFYPLTGNRNRPSSPFKGFGGGGFRGGNFRGGGGFRGGGASGGW